MTYKFRPLVLGVALGFVAVWAVSCGKSSSDAPVVGVQDGVIRAKAGIGSYAKRDSGSLGGSTRATIYNPGDALTGVQMSRVDLDMSTMTTVNPVAITADIAADGTVTFQPTQKYDMINNLMAGVTAWHPARSNVQTLNVLVDQNPDVYEDVEFCVWNNQRGTSDLLTCDLTPLGNYTDPLAMSAPLEFIHQVGRVELIFRSDPGVSLSAVRHAWGDITKIEMLDVPTTAKIPLAYLGDGKSLDNIYTDLADIAMLQSDYTTAFAPMAVPASDNTVTNAALMPLVDNNNNNNTNWFKLRITTTNTGVQYFNFRSSVTSGMICKIHLMFTANSDQIKISGTSLEPWSKGTNESITMTP